MDVVENVYNLIERTLDYITELDGLKCTILLQISKILTQLEKVVAPLLLRKHIDTHLRDYLLRLEAALVSTRTDLRIWNDGRSHRLHTLLSPWSASRELKDDRERLILRHAALMVGVQVVTHVNGYNIISPTPDIRPFVENKSVQSLKMKMKVPDADQTSIFEASQFWKCYIGDETDLAESEDFCEVLSSWLEEPLSDIACRRLILRLGEDNSGYISFSTFQEFIRNGNLRETVRLYSENPHLPSLIWIENDLSGIVDKVMEATSQGITVIQLPSTASAKAWIMTNHAFLKEYDDPSHVRFISNQMLDELDDYHMRVTNNHAGHQITTYIRDMGIRAPILIYTTKSFLPLTRYVEDYDMVGSLGGNYLIFQAYVAALAAGRKDDSRWMRYNA